MILLRPFCHFARQRLVTAKIENWVWEENNLELGINVFGLWPAKPLNISKNLTKPARLGLLTPLASVTVILWFCVDGDDSRGKNDPIASWRNCVENHVTHWIEKSPGSQRLADFACH